MKNQALKSYEVTVTYVSQYEADRAGTIRTHSILGSDVFDAIDQARKIYTDKAIGLGNVTQVSASEKGAN